jgi:hypothetical protein
MRYICVRSFFCITGASAVFLALHLVTDIQWWMFLVYAAVLGTLLAWRVRALIATR